MVLRRQVDAYRPSDVFRKPAAGQIFDTITNGKGLMASYRYPIVAHDRWAIIAYVRTMQRKNAEQEASK